MLDELLNYGWKNTDKPKSCNYITPIILRLLKNSKNISHICDLGSGNGALVNDLNLAGYTVCGVEYDMEGYRISKNNYPNINFYNIGVQDNPTQLTDIEGYFDAVVSTEVIEHLFSPHQLPNFAHGLLRKGGLLFISTPYHGYLKNLALSLANKWDHHHTVLWHGGHIKFFSRSTLTILLENNGFRVLNFYGVGRLPWLWKSMIIVAEAI